MSAPVDFLFFVFPDVLFLCVSFFRFPAVVCRLSFDVVRVPSVLVVVYFVFPFPRDFWPFSLPLFYHVPEDAALCFQTAIISGS